MQRWQRLFDSTYGQRKDALQGDLPDRMEASESAIHTFNFVKNPPRLRDHDAHENDGDGDNNAVDDILQQQQQMINANVQQ